MIKKIFINNKFLFFKKKERIKLKTNFFKLYLFFYYIKNHNNRLLYMDSTYREYTKLLNKSGKNQMSKSEYLNLIKNPKNKIQIKTLHQSLKIYYHNKDDNNVNLKSKESKKKNVCISNTKRNNINTKKKEYIKSPQKTIKKTPLKAINKLKGKIIYKESSLRKDSSLNKIREKSKEKINNKKKEKSLNNNNIDKENLTTSTTSPITTPVKGNNDLNNIITGNNNLYYFNTISFSGDNGNKNQKLSHYEQNKSKYNNFIQNDFFTKNGNKTIQTTIKIENPFENIVLKRNRSPISSRTFNFIDSNNLYSFNTVNNSKNININNINKNININNNNNKNELGLMLNIEDLIMIEDKINKLIKNIQEKNINVINKSCYEWWNYYFNCNLKGNCDYLFSESDNKNIITYHNSLLLISIMLIYDLSFNSKFFIKLIEIIEKILFINYENYLNICQYLISRIKQEYSNSKWVEQLKKIIINKINNKKFYFSEIEQNLQSLNKYMTHLINTSIQIINPKIITIYKNLIEYNSDTINKIFMSNILKINNKGGSLLFSSTKYNNPIINDYFIKTKPQKKLSLVLDLDETLMSFIYINNYQKEGILRLRPFIYNFLNLVKEYYEIIIFTAATQIYADPILDIIENNRGKYFNYRLYRNHCSIVNNNIVKDISLIGRNITKIIIVDNMQQNFILQKDNGILISSFWGDDNNDKSLLHLGRILVTIATDMIEFNFECDIRDEIKKYKDDILRNVSMS